MYVCVLDELENGRRNFDSRNIIVAIVDIKTRNFTNKVILELFIAK